MEIRILFMIIYWGVGFGYWISNFRKPFVDKDLERYRIFLLIMAMHAGFFLLLIEIPYFKTIFHEDDNKNIPLVCRDIPFAQLN